MTKIVDLHCHILPYVDDGALRCEESDELLEMLFQQGVRVLCATPHLRKGMFETPDEEIQAQFADLLKRADRLGERMTLLLSREYHCDDLFRERLEAGNVLCIGAGNTVLMEFSSRHTFEDILSWVEGVRQRGYSPLIAHIERYPALNGSPEKVSALIQSGAKIQMNAGSILGREGFRQALWSKRLLKKSLVHVVASDSHDPELRPPELDACMKVLRKIVGSDDAMALLRDNPIKILSRIEGDSPLCKQSG